MSYRVSTAMRERVCGLHDLAPTFAKLPSLSQPLGHFLPMAVLQLHLPFGQLHLAAVFLQSPFFLQPLQPLFGHPDLHFEAHGLAPQCEWLHPTGAAANARMRVRPRAALEILRIKP